MFYCLWNKLSIFSIVVIDLYKTNQIYSIINSMTSVSKGKPTISNRKHNVSVLFSQQLGQNSLFIAACLLLAFTADA